MPPGPGPTAGPSRIGLLCALGVVTPLGFATKFLLPAWLPGAAGRWCDLYGAAVLYEVFWVLTLRLVAPRWSPARCAALVLALTSVLEFLQLVRTPWLVALRRTFAGAALLGNGFDWWDFPHYAVGSAAGALLAWSLTRAAYQNPPGNWGADSQKT